MSNFRPDTGGRRWSLIFRFASSVQSCCGEGGALQAYVAVCGEHSQSSSHTGFAPLSGVCAFPSTLLRLPAALYGAGPALSEVPVFRYSTKAWIRACVLCLPRPERLWQPAAWAPSLRVQRSFSLLGPRTPPVGCQRLVFVLRSWPLAATLPAADVDHPASQEVFRQEPGPVCRVGGGGFSGAEFAPFPSPCLLPPAGMGRLFSGVSQSLCFANGWPFSLAVPQFKRAPSDCSQGLWARSLP